MSFSALQRAENSSIEMFVFDHALWNKVSVLFSEPKIPQSLACLHDFCRRYAVSVLFSEPKIPQYRTAERKLRVLQVSVLFSEPKIPQWHEHAGEAMEIRRFSALQRAENSSIKSP